MRRFGRTALLLACSFGGPLHPHALAGAPSSMATWNAGSIGLWTDGPNWTSSPDFPNNGAANWTVFVTNTDDDVTLDSPITVDSYTH